MNYTYDRTAAGLMSKNPLQQKLERVHKSFQTLHRGMERDGKAFANQMGYHGDSQKAALTMGRLCEKGAQVVDLYKSFSREFMAFFSELYRQRTLPGEVRELDHVDRLWGKLQRSVQDLTTLIANNKTVTPSITHSWAGNEMVEVVGRVVDSMESITDILHRYTRPKLDAPTQHGPEATPDKKLEGFLTPQVMGVVKTMARKFGKDRAACATLGILVLEDVNAHAANRAIEPLVGHYEKQMQSNPDLYDKLQSVVGSIGSAFQWDIIRSAAFMVGLLRVTGCPEASAVADKIGQLYEAEGLFH